MLAEGKTILISIICGIVNASSGSVTVDGRDIKSDQRVTRSPIRLRATELEKLQLIPLLVATPVALPGGAFCRFDRPPPARR